MTESKGLISFPSRVYSMPSLHETQMIFGHKQNENILKNENIMEGLLLNRKEYTYIPIYIPIVEGIRNVVTIGIVYVHNRNNQHRI